GTRTTCPPPALVTDPSGSPAVTAITSAPLASAAFAAASVSAVAPLYDTATTRCPGPTQPGSPAARLTTTGARSESRHSASARLPPIAEPPSALIVTDAGTPLGAVPS